MLASKTKTEIPKAVFNTKPYRYLILKISKVTAKQSVTALAITTGRACKIMPYVSHSAMPKINKISIP